MEITNAERTNKRPELARGVAVSELLATGFGDAFADRFPAFSIIEDPAAITLTLGDGAESGFEAVLRENPFAGDDTDNVTPVAALCQDGLDGPARAARIVSRIATREGRTESAVAREWFEQYLAHTVRPVVWLYFQQGVGLEAHQQNTLVRLDDDGRPTAGFYRDNQGTTSRRPRRPTSTTGCPASASAPTPSARTPSRTNASGTTSCSTTPSAS